MTPPSFVVAGRTIGAGAPAFLVAEVGANHGGDPAVAHRLVEIAAECGADAVKFQTYTSAELLADGDRQVTWGPPGDERCEPIGQLFDRVALGREFHRELFDHATELGLVPFSTPFSEDGVEFLARLGCPMLKLASSDVSHLRLIRAAASTGLPVLLSSGKSTLAEVDAAIEVLRSAAEGRFALLHCVAQYPTPFDALNLEVIRSFSSAFPDAVVGFSDHSTGPFAAPVAVAMGARIIEKHLTLDHRAGGPDDWFSADPDEFAELVNGVRRAESMVGDGRKVVWPGEYEERRISTRSLVLSRAVAAGSVLTEQDIKVVRPGYGIAPSALDAIVGLRLAKSRPENWILTWADFA